MMEWIRRWWSGAGNGMRLKGETPENAKRRVRLHAAGSFAAGGKKQEDYAREAARVVAPMADRLMIGEGFLDWLRSTRERIERTLEEIAAREVQELVQRLRKLRLLAMDYQTFRTENGLVREVEIPENRQLLLAVLAGIFLAEFNVSWAFFVPFTGNVGEAAGYALAPVIASFAFGALTARAWAERLRPRRYGRGLILAGAFALLGTGAHFLAAHTREAVGRGALDINLFAYMWQHPFELTISSVWLAILGMLSFVAVVIDICHLDERFPGYGKKARRLEAASAAVQEQYRYVVALIQAALHGNRIRADEDLASHAALAAEARVLAERGLRSRGVVDPGTLDGKEEGLDPEVLELLVAWRRAVRWLLERQELGSISRRLSRPEGADLDAPAEPRTIARLGEALLLEEALDWLRRRMEAEGFVVEADAPAEEAAAGVLEEEADEDGGLRIVGLEGATS